MHRFNSVIIGKQVDEVHTVKEEDLSPHQTGLINEFAVSKIENKFIFDDGSALIVI